MPAAPQVQIIPLGGLGEFGMNMAVIRCGNDCLIVDAGVMFPRESGFGIDVIIPDMSYLESCGTVHGVVLTHGHEDHIGALPYLLARHDLPVFGTPLTLALCRARLEEHPHVGEARMRPLPENGAPLRLGPFAVESLPTAHSIPQTRMLAIRTPAGLLVHTGDFKLDANPPGGDAVDHERLAALGDDGVPALLSDSTNATESGTTPSEARAIAGIAEVMQARRGRVFVTTFASNVHRVEALARLALAHGRRMALIGSSLRASVELAQRLGVVSLPSGVAVPEEAVQALPPERALIVATGSQGEGRSAMARIARGVHPDVGIDSGDLVVHSARVIPGNEHVIGRMLNRVLDAGADVVTARDAPVHVSGHPSGEELRCLLDLLRPRYLVPVHGEQRQLVAHARLAVDHGMETSRVVHAVSGDRIVAGGGAVRKGDPVPAGRIPIDRARTPVDDRTVAERRQIAAEGIVIPVLGVDRDNGLVGVPHVVTRGIPAGANEALEAEIRDHLVESMAESTMDELADFRLLEERVRTGLKRLLRRRTGRQPLICPIIKEHA